ncbi:MAG: hypothetical protein Kow0069_34560 [Promethearchaeota archaeon]
MTRHGAHCTSRAFVTRCRRCQQEVFYWECVHGCKVLFEHPTYGKLVKHRCRPKGGKKRPVPNERVALETQAKKNWADHHKKIHRCPSCGKVFKDGRSLAQHLKNKDGCDGVDVDEYFERLVRSAESISPATRGFVRNPTDVTFGRVVFKPKRKRRSS